MSTFSERVRNTFVIANNLKCKQSKWSESDVLSEKTSGERLHRAAQDQVCGSYMLWCPNTVQLQVPLSGTVHSSAGNIFWALGSRREICMQCLSVPNLNFFQVFYDSHYLYIFAPDNDCRQKWVRALKEGNCLKQDAYNDNLFDGPVMSWGNLSFVPSEIKNNNLVTKYHPNFWMDGKWRCCQQSEKLATGCQVYNPLGFGMCHCRLD